MSGSDSGIVTLLLDLDGTLVDSLEDLHQAVNHVLARFEREPLDLDTTRAYIGDGVRMLLARSFLRVEIPSSTAIPDAVSHDHPALRHWLDEHEAKRQLDIESLLERAAALESPSLADGVEAFRDYYTDHLVDRTRCFPGVLETLEKLAERGMRMAVVSNKPAGYSRTIVNALGIDAFVPVVVGGDTTDNLKPSPDPVRHALDLLSAAPGSALMVGDSVNDILAGERAGCRTAIVTYGMSDVRLLEAYEPDVVVDEFGEFAAM